jgi:hypothetical protein
VRIQLKKKNIVTVKKNTSMISIIATRESQKNPGINPSKMLASNPIFGPYILLVVSKTIHNERRANVTETNLPANTLTPVMLKKPVVTMSNIGG